MQSECDASTDEKVWSERRVTPVVDLGPLMLPSAFWEPEFDVGELSACHLPVMFWLSEALRPRHILAVGSGPSVGGAYLGACQAVKRLALSARCCWIVPHDCPSSLMSEPWIRKAIEFSGARYAQFSSIRLEGSAGRATSDGEHAIELVIVDAACPYTDLTSLIRQLDPSISTRAVLVVIGTESVESSTSARAFGDDLKERYGHFCFPQGEGMTVMPIGVDVAPLVQRLIDYGKDDTSRVAARDVFWRLGRACVLEANCKSLSKRAAWLFRKKEELKAEVSRRDKILGEVDSQIKELRRGCLSFLNE